VPASAEKIEFRGEQPGVSAGGLGDSRLLYPDRIVIGTEDDRSLGLLARVVQTARRTAVRCAAVRSAANPRQERAAVTTSLTSAEMIKYSAMIPRDERDRLR